jgi:hypothetical protein
MVLFGAERALGMVGDARVLRVTRRISAALARLHQTRRCRVIHLSEATAKFKSCADDIADRSGSEG